MLFLETDMAEIDIETIYEVAANLLEMDILSLKEQIFSNFARLFGHASRHCEEVRRSNPEN